MTTSLFEDSGAKPKSSAGRRSKPLNQPLIAAILKAFAEEPVAKDEDGEERPRLLGSATVFDTKGKATSEGRRYQEVFKKNGLLVRVTAIGSEKSWKWRVYVPLASREEPT